MSAIRSKAEGILHGIPNHDIRSNAGDEYFKYTGLAHSTMRANWDKGGIMTGCNAFVGWYGRELGAPVYLGRFDLATYLPSIGKGDAWVRSTGARRPQRGDILRHKSFHVDVCDGWDGSILLRIAAGQGGKGMGCDVLKRVRGKAAFDPGNLEGWIDIDLFFAERRYDYKDPLAMWLSGWWSVYDGNQYYYYFEDSGDVSYVTAKPRTMGAPPKLPLNQGSWTFEGNKVVIVWNPADGGITVETFSGATIGSTSMNGVSNRYAPLYAKKI
jgi:hypothetical protein